MAKKKKEREPLLRNKYEIHLEDLSDSECRQWLEAMFYYKNEGTILENISSGVKAIIRRQIEEREQDQENYNAECERQSKRIKEYWEKKKNDTTVYHGIPQNTTATNSNSKSNSNILNNNIKENLIKEKEINVGNLVKEFESNEKLLKLFGGSEVVREWLEYKQAKKERAYKTSKGFIQQMQVIYKDIQFGQPRGDISRRFEFAVNQAMENNWKGIFRDEKIEAKYQNFKSMNKQNE